MGIYHVVSPGSNPSDSFLFDREVQVQGSFFGILEFFWIELVHGSCLFIAFLRQKLLDDELESFSIDCHCARDHRVRLLRNAPGFACMQICFLGVSFFPHLVYRDQFAGCHVWYFSNFKH